MVVWTAVDISVSIAMATDAAQDRFVADVKYLTGLGPNVRTVMNVDDKAALALNRVRLYTRGVDRIYDGKAFSYNNFCASFNFNPNTGFDLIIRCIFARRVLRQIIRNLPDSMALVRTRCDVIERERLEHNAIFRTWLRLIDPPISPELHKRQFGGRYKSFFCSDLEEVLADYAKPHNESHRRIFIALLLLLEESWKMRPRNRAKTIYTRIDGSSAMNYYCDLNVSPDVIIDAFMKSPGTWFVDLQRRKTEIPTPPTPLTPDKIGRAHV